MSTDLALLQERIGYVFSDAELLRRALTHSSLGTESSNERLEFLGDRVLGLAVAEKLHQENPSTAEGGLAVMLNALVRRETCAAVAENLGLGEAIHMAASEQVSGGRRKSAILAGVCEAVIAAIYLDGGWDAARSFVLAHWNDSFADLPEEIRDAKTMLQEWAQSGAAPQKTVPVYKVISRKGPDHAPRFTVEVDVAGKTALGEGASKREAEQAAATIMLKHTGRNKE